MTMVSRFVGLDVHQDTISVAVAEAGRGPATFLGAVAHDWNALRKLLEKLGPKESLLCCYEAGPTGYGLYRQLNQAGYCCVVVAPSLVPKKSGSRIKTDRRDAGSLAHFLRSGDLTVVWVPDTKTEAIRDLTAWSPRSARAA